MTHVLVVEDDQISVDILVRLLRHNGIEADVAGNGYEALELTRKQEQPYELAIVDLAMPDMDGWRLLSELRRNQATETLNAVALTAYYDPQVAHEARLAGFLDCYPKPASQKTIEGIRTYLS